MKNNITMRNQAMMRHWMFTVPVGCVIKNLKLVKSVLTSDIDSQYIKIIIGELSIKNCSKCIQKEYHRLMSLV